MSWAALDTTDRSMSLMKLSIHLCNCTFISLLFCQGSELAVESTLCTFQDLAVCAALVINSLAPTQNNKHGGLVPLLLCGSSWYSWVWRIQLSGGNVGGEMLQKEEEGGREGGHSMVQGFLKGILSPWRHLQLKEGLCECIRVAT